MATVKAVFTFAGYHSHMGRLIVILLIVLLPLRGWSAERMAVQMAQGEISVISAGELVSMPADCPMLAEPASEGDTSSSSSKAHTGCQTCQLCMSLATISFSSPGLLAYECLALPASPTANFVSAELTRQAKPPIL